MTYEGKLYGKVGKVYIPLVLTSEDVDKMQNHLEVLIAEIKETISAVEDFASDPNTDEDHILGIQCIAEDLKLIIATVEGDKP